MSRAISTTSFASKPTSLRRTMSSSSSSSSSRRAARGKHQIKAGIFEDVLDSLLPKPMSDARKQMEYFDGPGGMLAKINPLAKKPTMKAPEVMSTSSAQVLFDFASMSQQTFQSEFGALNDNVMGRAFGCDGHSREWKICGVERDDGRPVRWFCVYEEQRFR